MSIKTGIFFFLIFCCIITLISGIIDHYFIMENCLKNWKKIRTKQKQYTLKIIKNLRTASLGSNFTGSYKKRVSHITDKMSFY